MPYAFIILFGFLVVWGQLHATNTTNARERTTHGQIDSAVSAVVYYGQYVRDVAAYASTHRDRLKATQDTIGVQSALNQIRADGTLPAHLQWFDGMNGLDGYWDSSRNQLWVTFYVPASSIHPVDNPGGLIGTVNKKVLEKYGIKTVAGHIRLNSGVKTVYSSVLPASWPDPANGIADAPPSALPERAIVYKIPLNLDY